MLVLKFTKTGCPSYLLMDVLPRQETELQESYGSVVGLFEDLEREILIIFVSFDIGLE